MERPLPDPLLLTAGKLTRKVIAPVHEAHLRHRLVKPLLILRVAVQKVRQHDIFIHVQHRKQVIELIDEADLPPPENGQLILFQRVKVCPVDKDFSAGGPVHAA